MSDKLRYVQHVLPKPLHGVAPLIAQVMVQTLNNVGFRETAVTVSEPDEDGGIAVRMTWDPDDTMEPPGWET